MIFDDPEKLKARIEATTGRKVYGTPRVVEDSSSYMSIAGGDVLRLENNDFYVMGDTCEGRGLETSSCVFPPRPPSSMSHRNNPSKS